MARTRNFEFRLTSKIGRWVFVILFGLAVVLPSYRVGRIAWANEQVESFDQERIPAALAADGRNPILHNWAGVLYLYGDPVQPEKAVHEFRQAVELSPAQAEYWANLGRACFFANDLDCAESAYRSSVAAAPFRPQFLNELAVYYLSTGSTEKALQGFRQLMEIEPSAANSALGACLRVVSPEVVWQVVVKGQTRASVKLDYLQLLSQQGNDDAGRLFWAEFVSSRPVITLEDVKPYLTILESKQNFADIVRVWQDLERMNVPGVPKRTGENLVVNGDFERLPTSLGLDWHLRPEQFLDTEVAASDSGNALLLEFTVASNDEHDSAYQIVPVEPGRKYEVRARVRSEDLTSDSGPRLRILDLACEECVNATSTGATGTTQWHEISTTFTTAASTHLVRVSVWRPRSRSYPAEIRGQFWLDDVSIRPVN